MVSAKTDIFLEKFKEASKAFNSKHFIPYGEQPANPNAVYLSLNGTDCLHFVERFISRISSDTSEFDKFLERLPTLLQQHKSGILSASKKVPHGGLGEYTIHYLKNHAISISITKSVSTISGVSLGIRFKTISPAFTNTNFKR